MWEEATRPYPYMFPNKVRFEVFPCNGKKFERLRL